MKQSRILLLAIIVSACTERSQKNTFTITLKNDSSKNLEINANVLAPSGDEGKCKDGQSGNLIVNTKSESSLALSIKCTVKHGAWLTGDIKATPLLENFLTTYKIFSYNIPVRLLKMEPEKINWIYADKTVPLGVEKKDNYVSDEYLYTPGLVKLPQAADFRETDNWYYQGSSHYRFFLITDKTVEKVLLEVDKDLVIPYKACDTCSESTLDGQLDGSKYKVEAQSISGMGLSLNITEQNIKNLNVSCSDQECVLK